MGDQLLSLPLTKEALKDLTLSLETKDNAQKMRQLLNAKCEDRIEIVKAVHLFLMRLIQRAMPKYGLTADADGSFTFLLSCRAYRKHDEDVRRLFDRLEESFLRPTRMTQRNGDAINNDKKKSNAASATKNQVKSADNNSITTSKHNVNTANTVNTAGNNVITSNNNLNVVNSVKDATTKNNNGSTSSGASKKKKKKK